MKLLVFTSLLMLATCACAESPKIEAMFGIGMGQKISNEIQLECTSNYYYSTCLVDPTYKPKLFDTFSTNSTKKNGLVFRISASNYSIKSFNECIELALIWKNYLEKLYEIRLSESEYKSEYFYLKIWSIEQSGKNLPNSIGQTEPVKITCTDNTINGYDKILNQMPYNLSVQHLRADIYMSEL